eukprot:5249939-Amphidinium_carterae.1
MECSHALIDKAFQQLDRNVLQYISPDICTTQKQELQTDKRTIKFRINVEMTEDGSLKIKGSAAALTARVDSDRRLQLALLRGALAYDQAGLLDFKVHSSWLTSLFDQLEFLTKRCRQTVLHRRCGSSWTLIVPCLRAGRRAALKDKKHS